MIYYMMNVEIKNMQKVISRLASYFRVKSNYIKL